AGLLVGLRLRLVGGGHRPEPSAEDRPHASPLPARFCCTCVTPACVSHSYARSGEEDTGTCGRSATKRTPPPRSAADGARDVAEALHAELEILDRNPLVSRMHEPRR